MFKFFVTVYLCIWLNDFCHSATKNIIIKHDEVINKDIAEFALKHGRLKVSMPPLAMKHFTENLDN